MSAHPRLPRLAAWLVRLSPVPIERRDEVLADLEELLAVRRHERGAAHAHWRLYRDVASLWHQRRRVVAAAPRARVAVLRDISGDLTHAARLFARQPAILVLTISGLSLGLGIATSAFSIMNVAVLRGEGLVDSRRVPGIVRTTERSTSTSWTYDEFRHLREGATRMQVEGILTETALARPGPTGDTPQPASLAFVSGGFFQATGARVTMGRLLDATDDARAGMPPVVVSFVFWETKLNRDPHAVGRTIRIGRTDATIVGVASRGFAVPSSRQLWMPLTSYGLVYNAPQDRAPDAGLQVFGRLMPDVSLAEAEAQMNGVAATLPAAASDADSAVKVRLDSRSGLGRSAWADTFAIAVLVFAVIVLVLALACANVATVLVSTAIAREREMAVRAAIGASRWRLVRQLITESLALGTVAAVLGLLVAYWAIPIIGAMLEAPAGADLAPDLSVFVFLGLVTLVTGTVAGLAPAWQGRGADLLTPLKGEGAGTGRVAPRRLRSMLVITQAAASVMLIVLATLFVRATFRAATIDVGFSAEGVYTVSPGLGDVFNDEGAGVRTAAFLSQAMSELRQVPGIAAVSLVELPPFSDLTRSSIPRDGRADTPIYFNRTHAEYFDTVGLRILTGRTYTRDEVAARAPVALVSQSLARRYWPDQSPLGELLPESIPIPALEPSPARPVIIGVVGDAITVRLHERNRLAVYEPLHPAAERLSSLLLRVAAGSTDGLQQASQRLRAIDPQADVRIVSVASRLQQEASRPRMLATLSGIVGIIAIVLCVIGLYGLTASVVGQRTREMGVRIAMGAKPGDLLRLLMWDSLQPVVVGLAAGAGAALLASQAAAADTLFGVSPRDPIAYGGAAVMLLAAALLAVLVPTRRAASLDAAGVLRRS